MKKMLLLPAFAMLVAACGQSVFALEVGMCYNGAIDGGATVETVECSEPHENEVYALFEYAETDVFPGDAVMEEYAAEVCLPAFEEYVGVAYEVSEIYAGTGYPSSETWDNGDREIVCSLNAQEGLLTGSMKGANR